MKKEGLAWQITNKLLNRGAIVDGVSTQAIEDIIASCLPIAPSGGEKKIHYLNPRDSGPMCNDAGKSPSLTANKDDVTCRRCRGMYVFDE